MRGDVVDPVLAAEQAHLDRARAELARMRRQAAELEAHGGDKVSSEYLAAALWRRVRALTDDPATTLFFGRTDHVGAEHWYIGRRHVADSAGDPVVIDWRADVARAFYRASRTEPGDVVRRRRFGVEAGHLTGYEDEHLRDPADVAAARGSRILAREIERPRVGPMRDIVATIQPEQDEIVRAGADVTVCVQGAPGTGKTAVGLHRAAWLLYSARERLARTGVLVIGPNEAFLEHVGAVLPALGEVDVRHSTLDALLARVPVRGADSPGVATLKGDARMAGVLRRAVWSHVDAGAVATGEPLMLPRGSRRWRVPAYELADVVRELAGRGVRYSAARAMLAQRLAHSVLLRMEAAGDSPDDRVQDAVARSREVRRWVDAAWPALDPARELWRLWSDPGWLARSAAGELTDAELALLAGPPQAGGAPTTAGRGAGSARWSAADAVLLDEIGDLLERTPSLAHVVLDEAQDLSPMQLRAVGRRCSTGSATVLGDIAQGTTPWATRSWPEALAHLGKPQAHLEVLDRGFRVPTAVIDLAARLLPVIAPGLNPPVSVRQDPGRADVVAVAPRQLWTSVAEAVREALEEPGLVGLVVATADVAAATRAVSALSPVVLGADAADEEWTPGHRLHLVPAPLAKGLEFDRVVLVEPAALVAGEPDERTGLRRLYVCLTRAVTALTVVHAEPLPPQLSDTQVSDTQLSERVLEG